MPMLAAPPTQQHVGCQHVLRQGQFPPYHGARHLHCMKLPHCQSQHSSTLCGRVSCTHDTSPSLPCHPGIIPAAPADCTHSITIHNRQDTMCILSVVRSGSVSHPAYINSPGSKSACWAHHATCAAATKWCRTPSVAWRTTVLEASARQWREIRNLCLLSCPRCALSYCAVLCCVLLHQLVCDTIVPTSSPIAARMMLPGTMASKMTILMSFSLHSVTAVSSITCSTWTQGQGQVCHSVARITHTQHRLQPRLLLCSSNRLLQATLAAYVTFAKALPTFTHSCRCSRCPVKPELKIPQAMPVQPLPTCRPSSMTCR